MSSQDEKSIRLPDFLIPGAGKSGTSSLCYYLNQHPRIYIPSFKEPTFFTTAQGFGNFSKGFKWYGDIFKDAGPDELCGEASVTYLFNPESPALIREHLGEVKLIFILRNPVERAYSNYWQDKTAGRAVADFSRLIDSVDLINYDYKFDFNFLDQPANRGVAYLNASDYPQQIRRYLDCFPRENMLFLLFEELVRHDKDFFRRIFEFLGVDPGFTPQDMKKMNTSSRPRFPLLQRVIRNRRLRETFKEWFPWLKGPANWLSAINQASFSYPPMDEMTERKLYDFFRPRIDEVETLIGRDLSAWKVRGKQPRA